MSSPKEKRAALLQAADELLQENCEAGELSVSQIAARAGVGKGTVYEYFASKEALIAAALAESYHRDCVHLLTAMETEPTFLAALDRGLELLARQHCNRAHVMMMLAGKLPPAVLAELERYKGETPAQRQALLARAAALLARGTREGVIAADLPQGYLHQTVAGVFLGYQCALFHAGTADAVNAARQHAKRALLAALKQGDTGDPMN